MNLCIKDTIGLDAFRKNLKDNALSSIFTQLVHKTMEHFFKDPAVFTYIDIKKSAPDAERYDSLSDEHYYEIWGDLSLGAALLRSDDERRSKLFDYAYAQDNLEYSDSIVLKFNQDDVPFKVEVEVKFNFWEDEDEAADASAASEQKITDNSVYTHIWVFVFHIKLKGD